MGKGRAPCCDKSKVKKGPWSPQEDLRLTTFIQKHGHTNWRSLPKEAGLLRCGKSCRLRWINYLRPDLKRGNFTKEEEETMIKLHRELGNKWSQIASCLPGRTDNEIKNVWHTHLKKKINTKEDDHSNHHKDEPNKHSKSSSSSLSSSSSTASILSHTRNQFTSDGSKEEKQDNDLLKENSSTSNSSSETDNCLNSGWIEVNLMQSKETDFLVNNKNQENYEMFINLDQDMGCLPLEIDFEFLEMLDKEDPFYTYESQTKEFELFQSNFGEENVRESDCLKWMKNLEKELLVDGIDQNLSQDACGQFLLSPSQF